MALRYLDGQLSPDDNEDEDDSDNDDSDDDNSFFKRMLFSKNASKGYYHQ